MKHFTMVIGLLAFISIFRYSCIAKPIEINQAISLEKIGKSIFILEDISENLTVDDVISTKYDSLFVKNTQDIPNLGFTKSAYWIHFDVINNSKEDLYLKVANSNLEKIVLYKVKGGKIISCTEAGCFLPFKNRQVKSNIYYFPILKSDEKGKTTFYIRLHYERGLQFPISLGSLNSIMEYTHKMDFIQGIYFGFMILMVVYNLILYFSVRDRSYLYYVFYVFSMGLLNAVIVGYAFEYLWPGIPVLNNYGDIVSCLAGVTGILFATNFLNTSKYTPRLHKYFRLILIAYLLVLPVIFSGKFLLSNIIIELNSLILILLFFTTAIIVIGKGYKPARFFLIAWSMLLVSVLIFIFKDFSLVPNNLVTEYSMQFGSALEAALLSLAVANKINVYKSEKEKAQRENLETLKANRKLILEQNIILEQKVESRTHELKETQMHLMRQEKLASLGQLTAGIAHEIKNPLNFVNNFSDISGELVEEMKSAGSEAERNEILNNLKNNLLTISHHGKRADIIIDKMLKHTKSSPDEKKLTDINNLCNEYMNLSFRGMQLTFKDFNCEINIHTDALIPLVNVAPFDFGRVMLNLLNNAFYAVHEKFMKEGNFKPLVSLITTQNEKYIYIHVRDNGIGIPSNIEDKLFSPFFTTKPTGQGTGLGLSLSYDIIAAHSGEIRFERSLEGFTDFKITLPIM